MNRRESFGAMLGLVLAPLAAPAASKLIGSWTVTITNDLVPEGKVYRFADPKFIGKHYTLEDTEICFT